MDDVAETALAALVVEVVLAAPPVGDPAMRSARLGPLGHLPLDPPGQLLALMLGNAALDPGRQPALLGRQVDLPSDGRELDALQVRQVDDVLELARAAGEPIHVPT